MIHYIPAAVAFGSVKDHTLGGQVNVLSSSVLSSLSLLEEGLPLSLASCQAPTVQARDTPSAVSSTSEGCEGRQYGSCQARKHR